jgi:hypothetical protein
MNQFVRNRGAAVENNGHKKDNRSAIGNCETSILTGSCLAAHRWNMVSSCSAEKVAIGLIPGSVADLTIQNRLDTVLQELSGPGHRKNLLVVAPL